MLQTSVTICDVGERGVKYCDFMQNSLFHSHRLVCAVYTGMTILQPTACLQNGSVYRMTAYRTYVRTSRSAYRSTLHLGGQKNVQNSICAYKSTPLGYRFVSDVADAINSVPCDAAVRKDRVFCDEINS